MSIYLNTCASYAKTSKVAQYGMSQKNESASIFSENSISGRLSGYVDKQVDSLNPFNSAGSLVASALPGGMLLNLATNGAFGKSIDNAVKSSGLSGVANSIANGVKSLGHAIASGIGKAASAVAGAVKSALGISSDSKTSTAKSAAASSTSSKSSTSTSSSSSSSSSSKSDSSKSSSKSSSSSSSGGSSSGSSGSSSSSK